MVVDCGADMIDLTWTFFEDKKLGDIIKRMKESSSERLVDKEFLKFLEHIVG